MTTIEQLTPEQLSKSEILEKIRAAAHEYTIYEQMSQAWNLANKLESQARSLIDSSPEIYKQYQKIISHLKFTAISFLTDEQVLELIEKHLLEALQEIDVQKRIRFFWEAKSVFTRDQFRRDVMARLKRNQQKIGAKTIAEWLLAYDKMVGARKNTSLERTKFLTQNSEVKALTEEDKRLLSRLLEFYDYIKITVPLPYIGVSETTLKEYFKNLNIPLPGEEEKRIPLPKRPTPPEPVVKAKEKKPGFFKRLFGKKPEPPKPEIPIPPKIKELPKEKPKKITPVYKEKISPYEKKRKIIPVTPKTKAPSPPIKLKEKLAEKEEIKKEIKSKEKIEVPIQAIRTMKKDIEKAKKRPIPPKPKTKDNIVDLSGK